MLRVIPFVIAAVAIAVLTYVDGSITDRWVDGTRPSAYCAELLKDVPNKIGDWEGVDEDVDSNIQKTAGAQGYVSRVYKHSVTGQTVDVWLIVGHARDTAEHTPDSCYPPAGFEQEEPNAVFQIEAPGQPPGDFWTAVFHKQETLGLVANRVFWAWFKPTLGDSEDGASEVRWIAPDRPRFYFGSTRALYKLYFTAGASGVDEAADASVCLEFAAEFLPAVEPILARANKPVPDDFVVPEADESA